MRADPEFLRAFDALPYGGYGASFDGRRWRVTKSRFTDGRSQKMKAEELGGTGWISLNLYRLESGDAILKPCEMPAETVRDFVLGLVAD